MTMCPQLVGKSYALDLGLPPLSPHGMLAVRYAELPSIPPQMEHHLAQHAWLASTHPRLARPLPLHV